MYLAVQELAQRTTTLRAPARVPTSRSSGRTPALISSWPGRRTVLSVPGCLLPWENRPTRYAAPLAPDPGGTKPALSTPMPAAVRQGGYHERDY
jgi:hypothetical protein